MRLVFCLLDLYQIKFIRCIRRKSKLVSTETRYVLIYCYFIYIYIHIISDSVDDDMIVDEMG